MVHHNFFNMMRCKFLTNSLAMYAIPLKHIKDTKFEAWLGGLMIRVCTEVIGLAEEKILAHL